MDYYTNDEPEICPILECKLMKPGCKEEYSRGDGMSIDTKFPYKIYSVSNYPEGIKFDICL